MNYVFGIMEKFKQSTEIHLGIILNIQISITFSLSIIEAEIKSTVPWGQ